MKKLIALVHYCQPFTIFQIFTIYLRYLLGGGFIMAAIGMGKLSNIKMPIAAIDQPIQNLQPIQQFFRVMIDSGMYWNFIGWAQIAAGILLMTQRFAALGTALFFGMILNIFIITISYDFRGTPIVTGLMLLATIYLLLWEIDKWQFFFTSFPPKEWVVPPVLKISEHPYWIVLGVILILNIILFVFLNLHLPYQMLSCLVVGFIGFIVFMTNQKRLIMAQYKEVY